MRITKVNIPEEEVNHLGLKDIKMDKLSNLVIISGKNGAGKTRLLNEIFKFYKTTITIDVYSNYEVKINEFISEKDRLTKTNISLTNLLNSANDVNNRNFKNTIDENTKRIDYLNIEILKFKSFFENSKILTDSLSNKYSYLNFVPKKINIADYKNYTFEEFLNISKNYKRQGFENIDIHAIAIIQNIQNKWYEATHQNSMFSEEDIDNAINSYNSLNNIIKIFLGEELTRDIDGVANIFGLPLGLSKLSDGQKILLQFCVAIYEQELSIKDIILVMDEPENHLHPSIIIETIERILKALTNGQLWISTHSIPLLAHFDSSSLYFVEDGKISYSGKTPEKVLKSLLGNEEEISKLQDFISLPAQFATNRYAFESLFEPKAIETLFNDPQSIQIKNELINISNGIKIRVLDYGAGKGRLISNVFELEKLSQEKIVELIDYIGYDLYIEDKEICENAIERVYGNSENRYFNDFSKLYSLYDNNSFDVVIMCNVLHEIDPKDWIKLFNEDGEICKLLKNEGVLLLIEDQRMPIGEKAYQKGFLVLDTPDLKHLFKIIEGSDGFKFSDFREDGRLKAHTIPRKYLKNIDADSRKKAIQSVSDRAKNEINKIRKLEKNYRNGNLHGFWTQQFANAQLNLEEL